MLRNKHIAHFRDKAKHPNIQLGTDEDLKSRGSFRKGGRLRLVAVNGWEARGTKEWETHSGDNEHGEGKYNFRKKTNIDYHKNPILSYAC